MNLATLTRLVVKFVVSRECFAEAKSDPRVAKVQNDCVFLVAATFLLLGFAAPIPTIPAKPTAPLSHPLPFARTQGPALAAPPRATAAGQRGGGGLRRAARYQGGGASLGGAVRLARVCA